MMPTRSAVLWQFLTSLPLTIAVGVLSACGTAPSASSPLALATTSGNAAQPLEIARTSANDAHPLDHFPSWSYYYVFGDWGDPKNPRASGNTSFADANYYLTFAEGSDAAVGACANKESGCTSLLYVNQGFLYDPVAAGNDASCAEHPDYDEIYGGLWGLAPLPESAYLHDPGGGRTRDDRVRGAYVYRSRCGRSNVPALTWALLDSDPSVIRWWQTWIDHKTFTKVPYPDAEPARFQRYRTANTSQLGGFMHDDMPQDLLDLGSFYSGGGCRPFENQPKMGSSLVQLPATVTAGSHACVDSRGNHRVLEIADAKALEDDNVEFISSLHRIDGSPWQQVFNGCGVDGPSFYQLGPQVGETGIFRRPEVRNNLIGCIFEGGLSRGRAASPVNQVNGIYAKNYNGAINTASQVIGDGFAFVLLSTSDEDSAAGSSMNIQKRMATLGMLWLVFDPSRPANRNATAWQNMDTPSGGQIAYPMYPEEMLTCSQPVQTMQPYMGDPHTKGVHADLHGEEDLRVATYSYTDSLGRAAQANVWRREFRTCWQGHKREENLAPSPMGPMAVLVNSYNAPVVVEPAWLSRTYTKVVMPVGGDIKDSAAKISTSTSFHAGVTTIPAGGALFLSGR